MLRFISTPNLGILFYIPRFNILPLAKALDKAKYRTLIAINITIYLISTLIIYLSY